MTDFQLFLLARVPHGERQHTARICGATAHGWSLLGASLGSVFHRYVTVIVSPRLHATWSRARPSSPTHPKSIMDGNGCFWTQPIGTAIDFMRATFRTAIET